MLSRHPSDVAIKMQGSAIDILQAFNEIKTVKEKVQITKV